MWGLACAWAIPAQVWETYCMSISLSRSAALRAYRNSNFWCRRCRASSLSDGPRSPSDRILGLGGLATPRDQPQNAETHGEVQHPPPERPGIVLAGGLAVGVRDIQCPLDTRARSPLAHLKFDRCGSGQQQ